MADELSFTTCPLGQKEFCDKERCAYWKTCEHFITGGFVESIYDQVALARQAIDTAAFNIAEEARRK